MSGAGETFPPDTPLAVAAKQLRPIIVVDELGLWGILDPQQIDNVFLETGTVAELFQGTHGPNGDFPHLHPDHSLAIALDRMGSTKLRLLPVVSRANVRQLLGVVTLEAVLNAYGFSLPPPSA
jgi:CBS domain-containing protein